jgi:nucleoside-diphosphate-sugar epimerase
VTQVLVTGASGFVGQALCRELVARGDHVRAAVRSADDMPAGFASSVFSTGDITPDTSWHTALQGVEVVVHLAAQIRCADHSADEAIARYRAVNRDSTLALARAAVDAGVRRLIFLSSVKVNGEYTRSNNARLATDVPDCFSETDPPAPQDPYAVSKMEAEERLRDFSATSGLEVVIVRPPLVYGPNVKGNFLQLIKLVNTGAPLPFRNVHNHRSLVNIENLVDFIACCITHPAAANETFLVADAENLSTPELVTNLTRLLGRTSPRMFSLPPRLMRACLKLIGREGAIHRLYGSLKVDTSKASRLLNWRPVVPVDEGLQKTVAWFKRINCSG